MNTQTLTITDADRARNARRPRARFACKYDTLADVIAASAEQREEAYEIVDTVTLDQDQWADFHRNLLTDRDFLAGKGGTDADITWLTDEPDILARLAALTESELSQLQQMAYREVVAVRCHGRRGIVLVDPQGYRYARYAAHIVPSQNPTGDPVEVG